MIKDNKCQFLTPTMGKFPKPYKTGIVGLLAILAITIIPFSGETNSNDGKFYGLLTLVNYDENGNEVFSQSVKFNRS